MVNILNHVKKHSDIYVLNYLLIVLYAFVIFFVLKIDINEELFKTTDSYTYLCASTEFYNFSLKGHTYYSYVRPFLYPMLILLVYKGLGAFAFWLLQFLFWIFSINWTFLSIKKITRSTMLSFIGSLIIALNVSYSLLTCHALTETSVIFLLSLVIYFVTLNFTKINTIFFFSRCLFILVLLAVIKPLFYPLFLFMLFIILPAFYLKKYIKKPKNFIFLFLIIVPIIFQLTIMKVKQDTFSFSLIGSGGFRWYLLAEGIVANEHISWEEARDKAMNHMSDSEEVSYILNNKMIYTNLYFQNLLQNIKAIPSFVLLPKGFSFPKIVTLMTIMNSIYFYIHLIFIIPILLCIYLVYKRKEMNYYFGLILIPLFLLCYIFGTIPIIFNEGDRYSLVTLPLWVFLYSLIFSYLFIKKKKDKIINS